MRITPPPRPVSEPTRPARIEPTKTRMVKRGRGTSDGRGLVHGSSRLGEDEPSRRGKEEDGENTFAFQLEGGFADSLEMAAGVVYQNEPVGIHLREEAADLGFAEVGVGVGEEQVDGAVNGSLERAGVSKIDVGEERRACEADLCFLVDDGVELAGDDPAGKAIGEVSVAGETTRDPLGGDAEEGAGLDNEAWLEGGDEGSEEFEDLDLGGHGIDHGPLLRVGALGGGAVVLGEELAGGTLVLEHDLVFLLEFSAEEAHEVNSSLTSTLPALGANLSGAEEDGIQWGMGETWTVAQMPSQAGRRAIVTGANSGIGYPTAAELARRGATVVLACRDRAKGDSAAARMRREVADAKVEFGELDLASLESVRAFAAGELARDEPLDLLINNAGVLAPKRRLETKDGFELQFGTNVLGHFALTGLLLPALGRAAVRYEKTGDLVQGGHQRPRVVTVASIAHKRGKLHFEDLQYKNGYVPMKSYQQSKLADLMFALEMDRRLRVGSGTEARIMSVAAHPGVANTNLFQVGEFGAIEKKMREWFGRGIGIFLNTEAQGALPTLYAATATTAESGGYYGSQQLLEMRGGDVGPAKIMPQALDLADAARLWGACEDMTGVRFL